MVKLLIVSGSPVNQSSTDLLLERIGAAIVATIGDRAEIQTTSVRLNEMKFIPCQACGKAPTPEFCFYDDDLTELYQHLAECDCLLFGSPIYFDSVSAQAKSFIDRCNCFRPADFDNTDPDHDFIKTIKRKRSGAIVLVGGEEGWYEGARRVIAGFFKWVEVVGEGMVVHQSTDFNRSGSVVDDATALAEADALGRKLAVKILE